MLSCDMSSEKGEVVKLNHEMDAAKLTDEPSVTRPRNLMMNIFSAIICLSTYLKYQKTQM